MSDQNDKSVNELLAENERLREALAAQNSKATLSREDRLALAIVRGAPFTMWACDRHFRIALWGGRCAEVYQCPEERAIGANYLELFVDPPEREQSRKDCIDIIDNGMVQRNFLAFDKSQDGATVQMLTNCFRVLDESTGEYLQAEVALKIDDYEMCRRILQTLRERGIAHLAVTERIVEQDRRNLRNRVDAASSMKLEALRHRRDLLNQWHDKLVASQDRRIADELTAGHFKELDDKTARCAKDSKELIRQITAATSVEQMDALSPAVLQFEAADIFIPGLP